jgi:hypothetical protein
MRSRQFILIAATSTPTNLARSHRQRIIIVCRNQLNNGRTHRRIFLHHEVTRTHNQSNRDCMQAE